MDLMIYLPKMDDDTRIIRQRLLRLGDTNTYAYESSEKAFNELLGMGKYIAGHLLNAWENPPPNGTTFSHSRFYDKLEKLSTLMIERDDLTMSQLQRYRRLITSEKL